MPKAADDATTPPTAPPFPSITDLGRQLVLAEIAHNVHDEAAIGPQATCRQRHRDAMEIIEGRAKALRALIVTNPAVTLLDAAYQIEVATVFADSLTGTQHSAPEAKRLAEILERVLYSVLVPVCAAAGVPMEGLPWSSSAHLRACRFTGVEDLA